MTDLADAKAARDTAIAAVDEAADEKFKRIAMAAIRYVAQQQDEFISDDIWDALARYYPGVTCSEARVMGPLMRKAVREGICEKTGRYRTGRRRSANATDQPIYRSL